MSIRIAQDSRYAGDERWDWSVWIEGSDEELDQIAYVAWQLHPTFPDPLRFSTDRSDGFRLETNGWGTFTVQATLNGHDGETISQLEHYLEFEAPEKDNPPEKPERINVYLSGSVRDGKVIQALQKEFERRDISTNSWLDSITTGVDMNESIHKRIDDADVVVAIVHGDTQQFVHSDIDYASTKNKPVVPIILGADDPPPEISSTSYFSFAEASPGEILGHASEIAAGVNNAFELSKIER